MDDVPEWCGSVYHGKMRFDMHSDRLSVQTGGLVVTDGNDPDRILRILHGNAISHRQNLFVNLAKHQALVVKASRALESFAVNADTKREKFVGQSAMDSLHDNVREVERLVEQIRQIDIQIANMDNLSKGTLKFFGTKTAEKSNVTTLTTPTAPSLIAAPKAPGSSPQAGIVTGSTNKGLERQRQRKLTSDDG